ncbi:MBL fold metallo-hydrolase RNA specificity domain-containing protein [Arthrobacter bambusae]|uniref:MBL fold metallo-hydrolase RNA specificity domain-containing protein n=1 Tax=Arthrobacter bambusae TaxID=1338426 RepID=UPI002788C82C|nr:MBL fold metallo-hydrolase [Arthrobacter bambusae]MDQ0028702.1 metallo-beta-lactamase family protein [Arthrobacter bambusae]MDQ0096504.1 metallo-beta-lactamase family protein [Arthrobacter bambusae]
MKGQHPARLRFLGATDTVTGSRYLLDSGDTRVLVDCGLFQGYKNIRDRNRATFPVAAGSIDAVLLTHAHLDHTGYVPALVRDGFTGPIYATHGTSDLCKLLLPDSGHLQEEEARYADHRGSSMHVPALPLYTAADAVRSLNAFEPRDFDAPLDLGAGIEAVFFPAGHILGAAQIHIDVEGHSIHFTGDLGRADDPLMFPPRELESADILVTESTYGNRSHSDQDPAAELGEVVSRVAKRGGVIMIAAFAVGRAETLLLHLSRLRRKGLIPDVPVYLNSPMAIDASYMYRQHPDEHRLLVDEFEDMYKLATMTRTADDSKLLNLRGGPMIIISASGMLTGGRILHHLEAYGPDPKNAIVLSGYQAGGTRGADLAAGAKELRIYGQDVPIQAEVIHIEGFSAHADADGIIRWMHAADQAPQMTYVTHGEPAASDALRRRIKRELGWSVRVPEHLEGIPLDNPF